MGSLFDKLNQARAKRHEIEQQQEANTLLQEEARLSDQLTTLVSQFQKRAHDRLMEKVGLNKFKTTKDVLEASEEAFQTVRQKAKEAKELDTKSLGMLLIEMAAASSGLEKLTSLALPPRFKIHLDADKVLNTLMESVSLEDVQTGRNIALFSPDTFED